MCVGVWIICAGSELRCYIKLRLSLSAQLSLSLSLPLPLELALELPLPLALSVQLGVAVLIYVEKKYQNVCGGVALVLALNCGVAFKFRLPLLAQLTC